MNKIKYYLVTFDSNYADEFDIQGFSLMNQSELDNLNETLLYLEQLYNEDEDFAGMEVCFGTNQEVYVNSTDFTIKDIDEFQYQMISESLGKDYGVLTPKDIMEVIKDYREDNDC